jgi:acyl-CoA reductase-like NAD-dependent aldehyde dehydrogenase
MSRGAVDAVTLSGSLAAGYAAQELCARRHLPLQAELGGNNAAIVCGDADLAAAAQAVAAAAFGFAGQRCTANRRVIVDDAVYDAFLDALKRAAAALAWGDPGDDATEIGPVISMAAHSRIAGFTGRAEHAGHRVWRPLGMQPHDSGCSAGAYSPPTIVCCDDAAHEIVQEETFGPVLVVQRAVGWDEAVELCNGVRQGLVAALFSRDKSRWEDFQERVHVGILKRNAATADVSAQLPFGGWGASGLGPSEHGSGDAEFYSRRQAVYGG